MRIWTYVFQHLPKVAAIDPRATVALLEIVSFILRLSTDARPDEFSARNGARVVRVASGRVKDRFDRIRRERFTGATLAVRSSSFCHEKSLHLEHNCIACHLKRSRRLASGRSAAPNWADC